MFLNLCQKLRKKKSATMETRRLFSHPARILLSPKSGRGKGEKDMQRRGKTTTKEGTAGKDYVHIAFLQFQA